MSRDKTSSYKVLCFIPMRNCERSISQTLSHFDPGITGLLNEILVIDNASVDSSVQVAKESLRKISGVKRTLFQNSRNYGLGGSHKIAFKYAFDNGYDYVLVVHGDNSVDVSEFKTWLEQDKFVHYDMILATRFAPSSYRHLYSGVRTFFNRVLNLFATIFLRTRIQDFSSGPMNIYRVRSFLNIFENPIKHFPNDVSFAQYLLCYGIFRRMSFRFHPVNLLSRDPKTFKKMATQLAKSILLTLKSAVIPYRTLKQDVFGTFFGHTYRKVTIAEEAEDIPLSVQADANVPAEKKTSEETPVASPAATVAQASRPVPPKPKTNKSEVALIDLRKLPFEDPYLAGFDRIDFSSIESCEVSDEGYLHLKLVLDVETVMSKGLKALFLRLFKIYSPGNIILDLNGDRVLNSRQFHEALTFLHDFGVDVHLVSNRGISGAVWDKYSRLVSKVTLGYEYGSIKREEFIELVRIIQRHAPLSVNIIAHPQKFYHCLGLKKVLEEFPLKSLIFQPYASKGELPPDHKELISRERSQVIKLSSQREHFVYQPDLNFQDARLMGFTRPVEMKNTTMKTLSIDEKGHIYSHSGGEIRPIGSLFEESGNLVERTTETT